MTRLFSYSSEFVKQSFLRICWSLPPVWWLMSIITGTLGGGDPEEKISKTPSQAIAVSEIHNCHPSYVKKRK
jgi:hypothetical protein